MATPAAVTAHPRAPVSRSGHRLADLSWPEVADLGVSGALVALPVGSTEQHGPHLPLSTDTDIALALAERLAVQRGDVVVAPPLAYGSSGEHAGFAGTISIGWAALELTLVEWGRSATDTFSRLVLVNGHGGNTEAVAAATRLLRAESRQVLAWAPRWPGDAHAGRVETALMLALHPDRVRVARAEAGNVAPLGQLLPALRAGGTRAVSSNGVLGDPTGATAEEGAALLERLAADLVAAVAGWCGGAGSGRVTP